MRSAVFSVLLGTAAWAGDARIVVRVSDSLGSIDPRLFGHFTEETLSSYEGSLSSEMLFNRKFEIPEELGAYTAGYSGFHHMGTPAGWYPIEVDPTVSFLTDRRIFFSPSVSQRITKVPGAGESMLPAGVEQHGYRYVMPHLAANQRIDDPFVFHTGRRYRVRLYIKNQDLRGRVYLALGQNWRNPVASCEFPFQGREDWRVYTCMLTPREESRDGKFLIWFDRPGTIWVDSVSLVPEALDDSGSRRDAIELARDIKPRPLPS
jgi:hypothetical protein